MTAPAANKTANKPTTPVASNKTAETKAVDKPVVDERIPATLAGNPILADFCKQFLTIFDEIAEYNKEVLAEKDSEWTSAKVMEKARELGRNDDATKVNKTVSSALDDFERLAGEYAKAKRTVLETTAKELGITLSATAERNPETEAPLKEKRKLAIEIGTQLSMIAKMMTDKQTASSVEEFLTNSPLPAIGRDQTRTFGNEGGKATPKYRVHIEVKNADGHVVVSEDGFTKSALALTKLYERGKALKSDTLRELWEKAGNTPDKTVKPTVEFEDNNLVFTITKK